MTTNHPIAHIAIVHTPSGVTIFIDDQAHTPDDLALLREVYERADEQRRIIHAINHPQTRNLDALTAQARANWRELTALLDAMALDRTAPALAVGQELARLREDLTLERNARAALDPLCAACATLADAQAWIAACGDEAEEDAACAAFDEAAEAIIREVARLRAGETEAAA